MRSAHRITTMGIVSAIVCLLAAACFAGAARASADYMSVSFVDADYGWIAGIGSSSTTDVWRTTNGGATWTKAGSALAVGSAAGWVSFASRTSGVWGNGALMHTSDGGGSWKETSGSTIGIFNDACFASEDVGWAGCTFGNSASGGAIAATTDGGVTWKSQKDIPGDDGSGGVSAVSSPSLERCYALKWGDDEGVWATSDGGADWTLRPLPHIAGGAYASYSDIDFPGEETGWAVGAAGTILRTDDAGATWTKQVSGVSVPIAAVDFPATSVGFAVGRSGLILRTRDGGSHWVKLKSGTQKWLTAVCFVDASHGWVVGKSGVLLRTSNGGKTWRVQATAHAVAKGLPRAKVGRPHLPSIIVTGAPFNVWGTLRPHHAAEAQSVKIRCMFQNEDGDWVLEKTVWATNHDLGSITKYVASVTLDAPGYPVACRLQAIAPADSQHSTTYSKWARGDVLVGE